MKFFPSRREVHRAQARLVLRLFAVMLFVALAFLAIAIGRYAFAAW